MLKTIMLSLAVAHISTSNDTLETRSHLNNLIEQAITTHIKDFAPSYQSHTDTTITSFIVAVDIRAGNLILPDSIAGYKIRYISDENVRREFVDWELLIRVHPIYIDTECVFHVINTPYRELVVQNAH